MLLNPKFDEVWAACYTLGKDQENTSVTILNKSKKIDVIFSCLPAIIIFFTILKSFTNTNIASLINYVMYITLGSIFTLQILFGMNRRYLMPRNHLFKIFSGSLLVLILIIFFRATHSGMPRTLWGFVFAIFCPLIISRQARVLGQQENRFVSQVIFFSFRLYVYFIIFNIGFLHKPVNDSLNSIYNHNDSSLMLIILLIQLASSRYLDFFITSIAGLILYLNYPASTYLVIGAILILYIVPGTRYMFAKFAFLVPAVILLVTVFLNGLAVEILRGQSANFDNLTVRVQLATQAFSRTQDSVLLGTALGEELHGYVTFGFHALYLPFHSDPISTYFALGVYGIFLLYGFQVVCMFNLARYGSEFRYLAAYLLGLTSCLISGIFNPVITSSPSFITITCLLPFCIGDKK